MLPLNKRAFAPRRSAAVSAVKRKRRDSAGEREVRDSASSAGGLSDSEDSDSSMDSKIDRIHIQVRDAEDYIPRLEQPAKGWKEAERTLAGYSKQMQERHLSLDGLWIESLKKQCGRQKEKKSTLETMCLKKP